ncbi:pectate lyase [Desmospora activa]|uniref:PelA/Pel-15E family pectate lyase n=1 Tax=Desmospora activa DSM 45169 TaxID=1121389 RepID=A0A2T4Z3V8_9BACL|nr:pectate lyase [Desmospora activa]PTM56571.1 PelA/Pel-15E family pectate lyase [Desmospora activa DSM 45169]
MVKGLSLLLVIAMILVVPPGYGQAKATDIAEMDMGKRLSEEPLKRWRDAGLIMEIKDLKPNRTMTRVEFFALVNHWFGLEEEDRYKNLKVAEDQWEVAKDTWYISVLETAQKAGYVSGYRDGTIRAEEPITRWEAAVILGRLLQGSSAKDSERVSADRSEVPDWSRSYIEQAQKTGYMGEKPGFGPKHVLKRNEMEAILEKLADIRPIQGSAKVVRVDAVDTDTLIISLNSPFDQIDLNDLRFMAATGQWANLSPDFVDLTITEVGIGVNRLGNTAIVLKTAEKLDENGKYRLPQPEQEYPGNLAQDRQKADYLISWQMDHGGWTKSMEEEYQRYWDGQEKRSKQLNGEVELGSIDNDATIKEIRFIAGVYRETEEEVLKQSVQRGLDFLLTMQYPSGGFPQVYPKRGNEENGSFVGYSNYVTFNDDAMVQAMDLIKDVVEQKYPFDNDIIDDEYRERLQKSYDKGVDYIVASQIEVDDHLTAWCAQHDPVTYEPREGRAYEHPSISGKESIPIVKLLMALPDSSDEVKRAANGALEWFEEAQVKGVKYIHADPNNVYFVDDPQAGTWYRFYQIGTHLPIFSGRDGVIKHDILEIEEERRNGYRWAGEWPQSLLRTAEKTGYFEEHVFVQTMKSTSTNRYGQRFQTDAYTRADSLINQQ